MGPWDALIYGFIQGMTEFFPISSSGHLALLPHLLKLRDPGVAFDLLMHLGTAFAVLIYFRAQVGDLARAALAFLRRRNHPALPWLKNFFFSTLASLLLIVALRGWAVDYARAIPWIAGNLIFFGVLMFAVDRFAGHTGGDLRRRESRCRAIAIGLAQALAIFPGVSRSGITLTMGRWVGLDRGQSTQYSFLLSLPIILGGVLKELLALYRGEQANTPSLPIILLGTALSFGVGMLAIHCFLKIIERWGLATFALYRLLLGGSILYFWWF